ncbi:hypothetical protein ABFS83_11G065200 [Erythranthe nasuta]
MYKSEKPQEEEEAESAIVFYNPKPEPSDQNEMIYPPPSQSRLLLTDGGAAAEVGTHNSSNPAPPPPPSSSGAPPKKRAETWVQEEIRALISLRKETDSMFNTSKSNKHLWENISLNMRERGFDRSPTMCTDKWRNLLKEYKKSKQNDGNCYSKMSYYKDIDQILRGRSNNSGGGNHSGESKLDPFMQFADKGIDDASLNFGPVEANVERRNSDHEENHPLAITASGVSPWNWRDTPGNAGEESNTYGGRVIAVKMGEYTKRIGIDGNADAIKEAIKSAFRLRTNRPFWLEDEYNVVRTVDRDMPLGNYTLHFDEGLMIKICCYEESEQLPVHTEEKTFYREDDFRDFLSRHGWTCLREYDGFRNVDCLDELCPGDIYRGVNQS